jgi:hypothetical protein
VKLRKFDGLKLSFQGTANRVHIFFLKHAGDPRIFVLRGKKGLSNYNRQQLTLDQSEGCKNLVELLQKDEPRP